MCGAGLLDPNNRAIAPYNVPAGMVFGAAALAFWGARNAWFQTLDWSRACRVLALVATPVEDASESHKRGCEPPANCEAFVAARDRTPRQPDQRFRA